MSRSETEGVLLPRPVRVRRWRGRRLWRTLARGTGLFDVAFLALVTAAAILAPHLTRHSPRVGALTARLVPPAWAKGGSSAYLWGTDQLGRDIFARVVYGARISLVVGLSTVAISVMLGSFVGVVAGYVGGSFEVVLMRLVDVQLAFPLLLLAIAVEAVVGGGLVNVILILGIAGWVTFARLARAQVLSVKQREYVEAARATGAGTMLIVRRYILPNIASSIIVLATAMVANNILVESALTFLGVGVQPDLPSWGNMLSDSRTYLNTAWWMSLFPGAALALTVLSVNLLGDWLRDYLDPTRRNL